MLTLAWAIYERYVDPEAPGWAPWLFGFALVWWVSGSVLKVSRARQRDKEREREESPADLLGCIHVLYHSLCHYRESVGKDPAELRITMHRVMPSQERDSEPQYLEQVIPYVGTKGGPPGRKTPISCGIIGLVARTAEPRAASRTGDDYEAYVKELVKEWGYSEKDAKSLTSDRQAWMAVPILDDEQSRNAIAVVYLDSADREFFTSELQNYVIRACMGLAKFVRERYK